MFGKLDGGADGNHQVPIRTASVDPGDDTDNAAGAGGAAGPSVVAPLVGVEELDLSVSPVIAPVQAVEDVDESSRAFDLL